MIHRDMPSNPSSPQDQPLQRLGATLRQYRKQQRLSQQALAARTGLAASYICDIERGQRNVSVLNLIRLADTLGLAVSHLLVPMETRQNPSPTRTE